MALTAPPPYGNSLGSSAQNDLAVNATAMDAPYSKTDVNNKLQSILELTQKDIVSEEVVNKYLPGFKNPPYQGFLNLVTFTKHYADPQYTNKTEFKFELEPSKGTYYNPSTVRLALPMYFLAADGKSEMPATMCAANMWPAILIDEIQIQIHRTEESVTSPKNITVYEYCESKLKEFDSEHLKHVQQDLQYSRLEQSHGRRSNDTGQTHDDARTNKNLTWRLANFRPAQINKQQVYLIDMLLLSDFFSINELINVPLTITMTLETNMRRLFETTKAGAIDSAAGQYNFVTAPYLSVQNFTPSSFWKTTQKAMMNSNKAYGYGKIPDYHKKIYELSPGTIQKLTDFNNVAAQFDWFKISLKHRTNINHTSTFDSYDGERATIMIESIEIENLTEGQNFVNRSYSLNKFEDQDLLYNSYIAYMCDGSSLQSPSSYKDSTLMNHQPLRADYFKKETTTVQGHPIMFDLRASRGYTNLDDVATHSDNALKFTIKLRAVIPDTHHYQLIITGINQGQYKLLLSNSGKETIAHFSFTSTPVGRIR